MKPWKYLSLIVASLIAYGLKTQEPSSNSSPHLGELGTQEYRHTKDERLLKLAAKPLKLTHHGRCRMNCRGIDQSEVEAMLDHGTINMRKSKPQDTPCPSYAVEGHTNDKQHVRIVFADCQRETRLITAIDLENTYNCHCR